MTKEQRQTLIKAQEAYSAFLLDIFTGDYSDQERDERLAGLDSAYSIIVERILNGYYDTSPNDDVSSRSGGCSRDLRARRRGT